jgi:hypothetical protein
MGYTRGLGKNGPGIVAPIMPEMMTPRTGLGYNFIGPSLPTLALAPNMEVLFIAGGFQTDFPTKQSTESIDEMVVPNMLEVENIIVVDILGCSTSESTPDPKHISLDRPS